MLGSMGNIIATLKEAFASELGPPPMSLRAANAIDSGEAPCAFAPLIDAPTPEYFEQHFWGIAHLDPASWRYYLPRLLVYGLESFAAPGNNAVDFLLGSLRPPDRDPPRFASLRPAQERAVALAIEEFAFNTESPWQEPAMIALEEYWAPGASYR